MVMRYHLGLAVGHTYAKMLTQEKQAGNESINDAESSDEDILPTASNARPTDTGTDTDRSSDEESDSSCGDGDVIYSDQELLDMDEMYGFS